MQLPVITPEMQALMSGPGRKILPRPAASTAAVEGLTAVPDAGPQHAMADTSYGWLAAGPEAGLQHAGFDLGAGPEGGRFYSEVDLGSRGYIPQAAQYYQQPAQYDQQPTLYDQQPTLYDQQPAQYDQQPTLYDQQPAQYDQQPAQYFEQSNFALGRHQPQPNEPLPALEGQEVEVVGSFIPLRPFLPYTEKTAIVWDIATAWGTKAIQKWEDSGNGPVVFNFSGIDLGNEVHPKRRTLKLDA